MTGWELLGVVAAFAGGVLGVIATRRWFRPPRAVTTIAGGEVHLAPGMTPAVHVVPPGTRARHVLAESCTCGPRRERLRSVEILAHRAPQKE